jgi:CheY-like chemotaxis protein/translation initiation factor IF-1
MKFTRTILWVDDKHSLEKNIFLAQDDEFKYHGISVDKVNNAIEAIEKLGKNKYYDLVVLDCSFTEDKGEVHDRVFDKSGIHKLTSYIDNNSKYEKIDYVFYTGLSVAELNFDQNELYFKKAIDIFYKNPSTGQPTLEDLIKEIKSINKASTKVSEKYNFFFKILENRNFNEKTKLFIKELLILTLDLTNKTEEKGFENRIRKVLEEILYIYNLKNVLPSNLITKRKGNEEINVGYSIRFLSGDAIEFKNKKYKFNYKSAPFEINGLNLLVDLIKGYGNIGSHYQNNDENDYTEYYTLKLNTITLSIVQIIFEMDLFLKEYVDNTDNYIGWKESNQNDSIDYSKMYKGTIKSIAENNYADLILDDEYKTKVTIPGNMVIKNHLKKGDEIKVNLEPSPNGEKIYIKNIISIAK